MNAVYQRKLQIVVLAAGFSSRLGQPKALARVHGMGLLRRTLTTVSRLRAARVIAVVPPNAPAYRLEGRGMKITWVANSQRAQGLSSSVRLGIAKARFAAAILLLPADLPNLKSSELQRLVRRWQSSPRRLIARHAERCAATPVVLPRWLYSRALTTVGDVGLREMIEQLPPERRVLVELPSAAMDIDTPSALREARRRRPARP
ncbi:MAG TPA: nucleotidyltransferase family protein [Steroidobacteraceae bacterium]|jgi:molybdenum cofactor cytidylyltransferase|nr:nucleotidyltransferase family protein [Steroidobacteraceae bacterium]